MYHQLHSLEEHPSVLELACNELWAMIAEGILIALEDSHNLILRMEFSDAERLQAFKSREHENITVEWTNYLDRRQLGKSPTLSATIGEAKEWLAQRAPAKLVDGA